MDGPFLDLFWDLASTSSKARCAAAVKLAAALEGDDGTKQ
eukprot:CAMPEP_0119283908 /NCGR_PEP_ID=MMETSP1329-20130426/29388_1 /TAXON_ID=114041 /ORGANISM="Genus nov. species nov., Strain RCC1024" /LENGTH=39 /DNA_ID= /DNA_START= /DNA_END= /DNA_ORIENTATION=